MLAHYLSTVLLAGSTPPVDVGDGLTLELVKQHLEYDDDDRDALISQYMRAATSWVENFTGKKLSSQVISEEFNSFGSFLSLSKGPFISVTSIAYSDVDDADQTVTGFRLRGSRIYPPVGGWPSIFEFTPITVTYQAGYTEVPDDLISAQLLLIGHWFQNREAATERPAKAIELAVESLCNPYRFLQV